jgi:hypothetical protein
VSGPSLGWVAQARVLMTAPDASLETLAHWLGPDVERGPDALRAGAGALPGAGTVTVDARDGVPGSLSAWYPGETGPTLAEAEAELGPAQELGRLQASPPQVAFPGYHGASAACFIAATTWDPPGIGAERRIFQLILRRDEIPRELAV